ncbi:MAG: hypothetical protein P8H59_12380 [Flavobacteriales bacterium]|nr:hypothetical protein [Flavobacteriales bacterium]MDG1781745.1 hypothetical protein [Flavobacteriales bacterium]MDG2246280.1 hypothetical protein [Flavobacteriales bacterium]
MSPQDILYPLGEFLTATFEVGLLPITNLFNYGAIVLGFVGLAVWLRMQLSYTAKARKEGTII